MNKRSLLSFCGLAPLAALSPIPAAASRSALFGEMAFGIAGSSLATLQLDTSELTAAIEAECAKFEAGLGRVPCFVRSKGETEWRLARELEWSDTIPDRFSVPDR